MTYVLITCKYRSHSVPGRFSRILRFSDQIESRNSSSQWDEKTYNQINAISYKFIFYLSHVSQSFHPPVISHDRKNWRESHLDASDFGLNDIRMFIRSRTCFNVICPVVLSKNFEISKKYLTGIEPFLDHNDRKTVFRHTVWPRGLLITMSNQITPLALV